MILARFARNIRAAAAMEFALTAPAFLLLLVGIVEFGLLFWTQLGLQHGTEMAARCARINAALCGSDTAIQQFAAQQALGLSIPSSTFTVSSPACGRQVSANYQFDFIAPYFGSITLTAQSCFPQ
jgi:Flp pilus assembly protein TadG